MAAPKRPSRKRATSALRTSAPSSAPVAQEPRGEPGCPVVRIGALEALEVFFSHVPPNPGIAFIIVSHIDPHATSFLPELLGRCRRGENLRHVATMHQTKSGEVMRVFIHVSPLTDEQGAITGFVTIAIPGVAPKDATMS